MFNEENVKLAKRLLEIEKDNRKKNNLSIFNLFKEDIIKLIKIGVSYKTIYKMLKKELDNAPISYISLLKWGKQNISNNVLTSVPNNNPTHTDKPIAKTKPSSSQKPKQIKKEEELSQEELDKLVEEVEHIWDMPPIEKKKRDNF